MHVYVSLRPPWFVLGAMSALGHMVFIWFFFKKRNEMKEKTFSENMENENNENKIMKKKQQNKKNRKIRK